MATGRSVKALCYVVNVLYSSIERKYALIDAKQEH